MHANGGFVFPHGISETAMLDWSTGYIDMDPWTQAGLRQGWEARKVFIDTDLVPDQEFLDSLFYRQFLRHHDIR